MSMCFATSPRGYKTFFMLNSIKHAILTATDSFKASKIVINRFLALMCSIYHANKCYWHFNIDDHDKYYPQLS